MLCPNSIAPAHAMVVSKEPFRESSPLSLGPELVDNAAWVALVLSSEADAGTFGATTGALSDDDDQFGDTASGGSGGGGEAFKPQGNIVVKPGEIQQEEINGKKVWVVLNHNPTDSAKDTFVEYAVGDTNPFGFPTEFYPVGTGTFHSERSEVWSLNLGPLSFPVTDVQYILVRDED